MSDKNKIFSCFYWFFVFIVLLLFHSSRQLNSDDGVILNGAWNMINGRHLYLDFFSFIPPASFYLVYIIWKIFGASFWSAQIVSVIIFYLAIIGVYRISQEISSSKYNYLVPIFITLITPWFWLINHNIYNLACLVWAAYFIIVGLRRGIVQSFILAGLTTGLGLLFLQQKGLAFLGATNLFLLFLLSKRKTTFKIIFIYDFFVLLPLSSLLFWPWRLLYSNLIDFPLFHYVDSNRISYTLFSIFLSVIILAYWFLRHEKRIEIKFLLLLQFCLLASAFVLPDFYHIFLMLFPLLVLSPLIFEKISCDHSGKLIYNLIPTAVILVIVVYSLLGTFKLCLDVFPEKFIETIKKNCAGPYLYVGPFMPGLYFESGKLNATPFDIMITGQQTPAQFISARQSLEAIKPECAILIYAQSLRRFNHDQNNPVESYIRDNYLLIDISDNLKDVYVYKRKQ